MGQQDQQLDELISQLEMLDDAIEMQTNEWQMRIYEILKTLREMRGKEDSGGTPPKLLLL